VAFEKSLWEMLVKLAISQTIFTCTLCTKLQTLSVQKSAALNNNIGTKNVEEVIPKNKRHTLNQACQTQTTSRAAKALKTA